MKCFLIYCDLTTMECTEKQLEEKISGFFKEYCKASDCLWFGKCNPKSSKTPEPCEQSFYAEIEEFASEESIIFIAEIGEKVFFNLPGDAFDFVFGSR